MRSVVIIASLVPILLVPTAELSLKLCEPVGTSFWMRWQGWLNAIVCGLSVGSNNVNQTPLSTGWTWPGQRAAAISNHFVGGLQVTQAQIDELWTIVKKTGASSAR